MHGVEIVVFTYVSVKFGHTGTRIFTRITGCFSAISDQEELLSIAIEQKGHLSDFELGMVCLRNSYTGRE